MSEPSRNGRGSRHVILEETTIEKLVELAQQGKLSPEHKAYTALHEGSVLSNLRRAKLEAGDFEHGRQRWRSVSA